MCTGIRYIVWMYEDEARDDNDLGIMISTCELLHAYIICLRFVSCNTYTFAYPSVYVYLQYNNRLEIIIRRLCTIMEIVCIFDLVAGCAATFVLVCFYSQCPVALRNRVPKTQ